MTDDEIADMIAKAKNIVFAVSASQVGDVNSMANLEAEAQLEAIGDDPQLLFAVLRVFAGATSMLAELWAEQLAPTRSKAERDEIAVEALRRGIDHLELQGHRRLDP